MLILAILGSLTAYIVIAALVFRLYEAAGIMRADRDVNAIAWPVTLPIAAIRYATRALWQLGYRGIPALFRRRVRLPKVTARERVS